MSKIEVSAIKSTTIILGWSELLFVMKEKPDFGFLEKLEIPKKWISISANWKQKRDLNLKKVLETSIQRAIRSVVSIGCFILDFYFFPPNFESSVQTKSSSIDSSNINKRFQSKKVSETSAKDISEFWKRGLQLEIIFWIFYSIFSTKSRKFCSKSSHIQSIRQIYIRRRCCCCYSAWTFWFFYFQPNFLNKLYRYIIKMALYQLKIYNKYIKR